MADADFHTRLQSAITKIRGEMPDVASAPISASTDIPAGMAAVTRGGDVTYDPAQLAQESPAGLESVVAHELTHVRQNQNQPWYAPFMKLFGPHFDYQQDPEELEAYQVAADRSVAHQQTPRAQPNFLSGGLQRGDIRLPTPRSGNRYNQ